MSIFTRIPRVHAVSEGHKAHIALEPNPITPDDLIAPTDLYEKEDDMPVIRSAEDCAEDKIPITVKFPKAIYRELTAATTDGKPDAEVERRRAIAYRMLSRYLDDYYSKVTPDNVHLITGSTAAPGDLERARHSLIALRIGVGDEAQRLLEKSHFIRYGRDFDYYVDTPTG